MKFEEALAELRKGKKIECIDFPIYEIALSELNKISITFPSGISCFSAIEFIVKGKWKIIEEPGKSFPEVFESFKEGKKIRCKSWPKEDFLDNKILNYTRNSCLLETDWEVIE